MSKKMLKRSLALGALMAFVITGQAWAAEVVNGAFEGYSDRYTALGYNGGTEGNLQIGANEEKKLESKFENTLRNYGIALDGVGSSLSINGEADSVLTVVAEVDADGKRAYGIRNISNSGILEVDVSTVNVTANAKKGDAAVSAVGIANYGKQITILAEETNVNVTGSDKLVFAVTNEFDGGINQINPTLTINNLNATVTTNEGIATVNSGDPSYTFVKGVNTTYGTTTLAGNTTVIKVINNADNYDVSGAMTQGNNYENQAATLNFDAVQSTVINVTDTANAGTYVSGLVASGPAGVLLNSLVTNVTVESESGTTFGLRAQGNGTVTSKEGTSLSVVATTNADKDVTGIGARYYNANVASGRYNLQGTTTVTATNNGTGRAYGVYGEAGADIDLADITITATSKEGIAYGVYAKDEDTTVTATGDLNITATGSKVARGIEAREGSSVSIGNDTKTNNVTINAVATNENASDDWVIGVFSRHDGSSVDIKGDTVTINATATGTNMASGILANTMDVNGVAKLDIDANNIVITANATEDGNAAAITTMSGSKTTIKGNLTANGDRAIYTRGDAKTYINAVDDTEANNYGESLGNTVVLNGDISFSEGYGPTNGIPEVIDATVVVNFDGEGSEFNGAVITTTIDGNVNTAFDRVHTGATLGFYNGAKWNLKGESIVNDVTFGADSVLNIENGSDFEAKETDNVYALNATNDSGKLTIDQGAKLQIGNIKETTYNIATGFASYEVADSIDIADNALLQANKILDVDNKTYQVKVEAKKADQMAADTGISESTAGLVQGIIENADKENKTSSEQAAVEFIQSVVDANGSDSAAVGAAINAATKMGEAGGNSATAASIVKNVTGVTNDRLSFNCGHSAPHKGGHGVGLFEEGSGADIWVEYVHGKDEVEDMPSTAGKTSYEGQYNGIVMGVDFKKVNKFQSGIAFNYGEGDTNSLGSSVRTHSDYDFWGVGYYGNIHNDDSNVIFDINYAKTDSDVTQYNSRSILEASPETTTWSAGVKLEKLYQNENVQIVPYTGLRYMSIDADDYSTKKGEFYYSMDRQDIWLLPLGVSIRQEVANDNGWTVSPRVDLSYIWAFGDTNSNMEVKSPFPGVSQIGYDVMDDGSFLGLVGIEAHKGQWGYGVAYSYQKGDHSESKKWYVDVNYSF